MLSTNADSLTGLPRSFAVAGPREWNDLPATLRNTELTMDTFCKHLKTVSFTDSWGRGAFVTF